MDSSWFFCYFHKTYLRFMGCVVCKITESIRSSTKCKSTGCFSYITHNVHFKLPQIVELHVYVPFRFPCLFWNEKDTIHDCSMKLNLNIYTFWHNSVSHFAEHIQTSRTSEDDHFSTFWLDPHFAWFKEFHCNVQSKVDFSWVLGKWEPLNVLSLGF